MWLKALEHVLNPVCQDVSFLALAQPTFSCHPEWVVVQPWRGRHNVYGIFKIPQNYSLQFPILLSVQGAGHYRKEREMVKFNCDPVASQSQYLKVHLKTRVALRLVCTGWAHQLHNPQNWTLTCNYTDLNASIDRPNSIPNM